MLRFLDDEVSEAFRETESSIQTARESERSALDLNGLGLASLLEPISNLTRLQGRGVEAIPNAFPLAFSRIGWNLEVQF